MKYYYLFLALSLVLGSTNYVAAQHKYAKVVIKSHKGKSFKMKIDKKSVYPRNAKRLVMMMKTNKGYPVCFNLANNPSKVVADRHLVLSPKHKKVVYTLRQNRLGQYYLQSSSKTMSSMRNWIDSGKKLADNYSGKGSDWVQNVAGMELPRPRTVQMNGVDYKLIAVRNSK